MNRRDKVKLADQLFRDRIRARGFCQAQGFTLAQGNRELRCWGPLETAHVIRRWKVSDGIRWDDSNAACLCMMHHAHFHSFPIDEERFHRWLLSPERFEELRRRAERVFDRADMDAVLERLRRP